MYNHLKRVGAELRNTISKSLKLDGGFSSPPVVEDSCVDLSQIKWVRYGWYEKPSDLIVVQVFVEDVAPQHLCVEADAIKFFFRTSDAAFLKNASSSSSAPITASTIFRWSIPLKNSVELATCGFEISRNNVEITLKKRHSSIGARASSTGSAVAPLLSRDGAGPSGVQADETFGAKSTTTTNSKPTYSSVSYFRDTNDVSSTSSSSGLRPPSATNQCHTTTVASSSSAEPTCLEIRGNYFGMTGLDNMGNTCFVNAVLQCLANLRELRDYFLCGGFQKDIKENPLGLGGELANSYDILLKVLWGGSTRSYAPSALKFLVDKKVE